MTRRRDPAPSALQAAVVAALLADVGFLLGAVRLGAEAVRDGEGSVTTGYNLTFAILATFTALAALEWLPVGERLKRSGQLYGLVAQGLHSAGHLARWYYEFRWYDDALHTFLTMGAGILALRLAQALDLFPPRHATPVRAGVVALVATIAIAGLWEIFEFTMDSMQGTREQDDLTDTMLDMVDGMIGGVIAAAWCAARPRGRLARRQVNA